MLPLQNGNVATEQSLKWSAVTSMSDFLVMYVWKVLAPVSETKLETPKDKYETSTAAMYV